MTGAGTAGAAGIIKCLLQDEKIRLTIADADENAVGRYLHNRFFAIPGAEDERFVDAVLMLCLREKIDLVLPLVTKELFPLSQQKKRFEEAGIKVLVSSYASVKNSG